jgi:hypothetical protein
MLEIIFKFEQLIILLIKVVHSLLYLLKFMDMLLDFHFKLISFILC